MNDNLNAQNSVIDQLSINVACSKRNVLARKLPASFVPGPLDVICARGKDAKMHEGNQRLRFLVQLCSSQYSSAISKLEKSMIVSSIVDVVRLGNCEGFVKKEKDGWYEVGDKVAREKCGQW
jgi:hypothetical protein